MPRLQAQVQDARTRPAAGAISLADARYETLSVPRQSYTANWAQRALIHARHAVAKAAPGTRNHTLNGSAYALGRLVANRWLRLSDVVDGLTDAAHRSGLVADDGIASVRATIRSGLIAGMARPYPPIKPPE